VSTAAATARKTCPTCGASFDAEALFCPKDGSRLEPWSADDERPPDSDPYIGTVIGGDIELRSVAGAGAMGRVYRAHQRGIDRDVAVKILHRELSGNPQLVQRFHREAKIASKLQHPHVVEVYLAGQLPDRALYIVMEYLDGMSLAAALAAAGGTLPIERALTIALQICDAVGEGHARGIVHRDIKPENVMLVRRAEIGDWVKVLDFGIAKVSLGEQSMETAAGLIFGTARYISPEGAQGATVGPPGDVYSLATIVYHLLAGRTPFDAEQAVGMLIKHIHEPPPPLRSWPAAAAVPEAVARVVMDNLAKEPSKRAPSARAFASALAAAARDAEISLSDVGVVSRLGGLEASASRAPRPPSVSTPGSIGALEPTLDDHSQPPIAASLAPAIAGPPAAGLPSGVVPSAPPPMAAMVPAGPTPPDPRGAASLAPPPQATPAPAASPATPAAPSPSTRPPGSQGSPRKGPSLVVILLAFLLGAAIAVIATQQWSRHVESERDAYVARARHALNESRYVSPPGDNVRDVVAAGLKRWPDDARLIEIRSDAAHELLTRAMAARSSGDIVQARDLARFASELEPSDGTAHMLLEQYGDELSAVDADGGAALAGARVLLDVTTTRAKPGGKVDVTARVLVGARAAITGQRFVVTGPGLPESGKSLPPTGSGPYRASFVPPREGSYEITFEANAEGQVVRANRTFDVAR